MPPTLPSEFFTSGEIVAVTGIKYRTLDHWARSGFILPSLSPGGRGKDRLYSQADLDEIRVAMELRRQGITARRLMAIVRKLRERDKIAHPLIESRFIVVRNDLVRALSDKEMVSMIKAPDQTAFAFLVDLRARSSPAPLGGKTTVSRKKAPGSATTRSNAGKTKKKAS